MEIWKDIPGFENCYQASNLGRIKSLNRTVVDTTGRVVNYKGRVLKQANDSRGYLVVSLANKEKTKTYSVHRLCALSFLDSGLSGYKIVVDHINNDKQDNRIENLQVITQRENSSKDKFRINRTSKYIGVFWSDPHKKWGSCIGINSKTVHLGFFPKEFDAHLAYQNKLKSLLNE